MNAKIEEILDAAFQEADGLERRAVALRDLALRYRLLQEENLRLEAQVARLQAEVKRSKA